MIYVALLRGINVGGKNRVEMSQLKALFQSIDLKKVKTYINSGNVIFESNNKPADLKASIEDIIKKELGLTIRVLIINRNTISDVIRLTPVDWANDYNMKTDVMFLWQEIDTPSILDKIVVDPEIENVLYVPGALIWNIKRKYASIGNGIKLIKTDLYKQMTVRNINTVRKLNLLMNEMLISPDNQSSN